MRVCPRNACATAIRSCTGSRSFALTPGLTYLDQNEHFLWGASGSARIYLDENDNSYRLGEVYEASLFGAYKLGEYASISFGPHWKMRGNIRGADPRLNPMMVPTADPTKQKFHRLEMRFGLNLFGVEGALRGHRLVLDAGVPA